MEYSIAALFGFVQGVTEFIPVSSSGHLLILHSFFPNFQAAPDIAFDVSLHFGTLLALCIFYAQDIFSYVHAWLYSIRSSDKSAATNPHIEAQRLTFAQKRKESIYVLLAALPAACFGALFENLIDTSLRSPWIVVIMLIAIALLFFLVEKRHDLYGVKDHALLRMRDVLLIGCFQVFAFIPGTSRSGITIIAGMLTGLTRGAAARFSFLIAIPLIGGASIKKGIDLVEVSLAPGQWTVLGIGVLTSFITGYCVLRFLRTFFTRNGLHLFAWYRIVLGIILALVLLSSQ